MLKMKISILDTKNTSPNLIYKDWAGGFGTKFTIGNSLRAKAIEYAKKKSAVLPVPIIGYITAIFRKYNHEVSIDFNKVPEADLVIMHSSLVAHKAELKLAKKIKQNSNAKLGFIGPLASVKPELYSIADFIIKGEPEDAITEIAKTGKIPEGVVNSRLIPLDELPFPDWEGFNIKKYSYYPALKKAPVLPVLSSRGCPYICNYCPYKVGYKWRIRSAKNVVDEIEYLIERYNIKGVCFRDAIFTFDRRRMLEFAEEIKKRNIKIDWACETHLNHLDKELIDTLYESGMRSINVGIETLNDEILKGVKRKPINIKHQEEIINYCDKKGIHITAFYIIGLPNDTIKSIKNTIEYAKRLNTHVASFTVTTPFPGTEFYEQVKDRIYDHNWENHCGFLPVYKHDKLSKRDILKLKEYAFTSYYFRPRYILNFIRRML